MILDGKQVADKICLDLKNRVDRLSEQGVRPRLMIVTSGDNVASAIYVRNKVKRCAEIGIISDVRHYETLTTEDALECIAEGVPIIFQLPMEGDVDVGKLFERYVDAPELDVDGFMHSQNVCNLAIGNTPANYPCTPLGICNLLSEYEIDVEGKSVCIIGRSNIVGRPLARMMENSGATVTLCHSKTPEELLYRQVEMADVVVSATGARNVISLDKMSATTQKSLKDKVFVDVGINRDENRKLCGDIDKRILELSGAYTPVPGGVGPMTVAMLMNNVVKTYENFFSRGEVNARP